MKRHGNLIAHIIEPTNMERSFDDVIGNLTNEQRKAEFRGRKEAVVAELTAKIADGSFRITQYNNLLVTDGPKVRVVQAPPIKERVGCHAIMNIVDRVMYRSIIPTSAASIPGRGMHYLFNIMRRDIRHDPEGTRFYFKCDIKKFYESIDQNVMMEIVRRHIKDPVLLPMLENFVRLMPHGLAIGLRSSQCFGNMLLSPVDHFMKEVCHVRYYYRYCDDIVMLAGDKASLWHWRDVLHEQIALLHLTIKEGEVVRPLADGLDFLGYVNYGTHALLRKRIKQRFARHMAKVKSRKRRVALMGAFKGMAIHADCNHLYKSITDKEMKRFSELGISFTPADGKKRFPGKVMRLGAIVNKEIELHDFETGLSTSYGSDRYVVSFRDPQTNEWGKFFTTSEEMQNILDQIALQEDESGEKIFPILTTIVSEVFDGNKVKYRFT